VTEPNAFEAEITTGKLRRYKSPGADQIPVGGGDTAF
jgi:hypothetical protein